MMNRWTAMSFMVVFLFAVAAAGLAPNTPPLPEDGEVPVSASSQLLSLSREDLYSGSLILVNRENGYAPPEQMDLVPLEGSGQGTGQPQYLCGEAAEALGRMLSDCAESTGEAGIGAVSAYRTLQEQEEILGEYVQRLGTEEASQWCAEPGYSEHHTGYAVDLGIQGRIGRFGESQASAWLADHCFQYGFVRRYDAGKADITGFSDEPWHFRYVGVPHGALMKKMDFCMEEYLQWLRNYPWEGEHLYCLAGGRKYEIYFVPAQQGEETLVPVPQGGEYVVSGNNRDGFLVTVKAAEDNSAASP